MATALAPDPSPVSCSSERGRAGAQEVEGDFAAGWSAQQAHGFAQGKADSVTAIDALDNIARLDACQLGGGSSQRGDDDEKVVLLLNRHSQTLQATFGLAL